MTISPEPFEQLIDRYQLLPEGVAIVSGARSSPPARQVTSRRVRNTPWRYASHKMGCSISAESSLEKTFFVHYEYDDDVIEYWDQPCTVHLSYQNAKGHWHRSPYTPDVLVLRKSRIEVIQIKPSVVCEKLVKERSGRWKIYGDRYEDTAASHYFESIGLRHVVVTEKDICPLLAENATLLLQARHCCCMAYTDELKARALKAVSSELRMTIAELMESLRVDDATPCLKMIDDGLLCSDIQAERLSEIQSTLVAISPDELAKAREAREILLVQLQRDGVSTKDAPHPRDAAAMVDRLRQLRGETPCMASKRTQRRWKETLAKASGNPLSLIPATRKRGRRGCRVPNPDICAAHEAIQRHYLSSACISKAAAHRLYLRDIRKANRSKSHGLRVHWVSLPTFIKMIDAMDAESVALCRGGQRAAHATAMPVDAHLRCLKATRPLERVHIDHYKLDQHLVLLTSRRRIHTRRAWLTVARDEYTGAALAMSLSFDAPSRVACATVLRDCVRRHGRLPEIVVVDNGKEFESVYFEALLARYGVTKQSRPSGAPRFGAPIESLFRTLKELYLRAMPGNTTNDERGRSVSPSHRGQAHAKWTLRDAYFGCEHFFWRCFNALPARGREASPEVLLASGLRQFSCSGVPVTFDEQFVVATAIPLTRLLKIDPQRGVRHLGRWYVHPALFTLKLGTSVDALSEPWDARCLYVLVGDRWVPCFHGPVGDARASVDMEVMLEAITLKGREAIRASQEQHRQEQIAAAIEEGKKQAAKRKSESLRLRNTGTIRSPVPRLPAPHTANMRFSHFDDQES